MIREIVHDPLLLALKSEPAVETDRPVITDLADTLTANRDRCVGMAANMIGERKRIIVFFNGPILMAMVNQGMSIPLAGTVILKDATGSAKRTWTIVGAHLMKYIGPDLDSNQPALAVSRIELIHNGCY